jgi:hypothetical protein
MTKKMFFHDLLQEKPMMFVCAYKVRGDGGRWKTHISDVTSSLIHPTDNAGDISTAAASLCLLKKLNSGCVCYCC